MNPSHIIGRPACILAAQSGAPLASIVTAPRRPGHPTTSATRWSKPVAARPRVGCTLP